MATVLAASCLDNKMPLLFTIPIFIKNIKVPIKNPSLYEGVNYIPFGIILRVATL
jgi:hypothetical protein